MSKKFDVIFDLSHVEDLDVALAKAQALQFNKISTAGFNLTNNQPRLGIKTSRLPFIGLRQNREPVIAFRCRAVSLAERLLEKLHVLRNEKNPEPVFCDTPHVTYHDATPDWETKYTDLVKAVLAAAKTIHDLSSLIHALEQDHPDLVEELCNEN